MPLRSYLTARQQLLGERSRVRLRPIRPVHRVELNYRAELIALVDEMARITEKAIKGEIRVVWPTHATDALPPGLHALVKRLKVFFGKMFGGKAEKLATIAATQAREGVDARLISEVQRAIGVNISGMITGTSKIASAMRSATADNIALIKSIPEQYLDKVEARISVSWEAGARWETVAEDLSHVKGVTKSRVKLIARDQTAKMNSVFNEVRQTEVGITEYEWSTSADERVRTSHRAMHGKKCSWANPPIVDGEAVNPGIPVACRCVALPIVTSMFANAEEAA